MNFNEFLWMVNSLIGQVLEASSLEENAMEIFKMYDKDKDGYVELSEFNEVNDMFGETIDGNMNKFFEQNPNRIINLEGN